MTGSRPRVLVVEDEVLIALLLEDMLVALECEVADSVGNLDGALAAVRNGSFDLALVDLNLGGKSAHPVADALMARRVPFAFVSGYGSAGLDPAYAEIPVLEKPFHQQDLKAIITRILSSV
jgi:DNA-binding response OmpR family regulator